MINFIQRELKSSDIWSACLIMNNQNSDWFLHLLGLLLRKELERKWENNSRVLFRWDRVECLKISKLKGGWWLADNLSCFAQILRCIHFSLGSDNLKNYRRTRIWMKTTFAFASRAASASAAMARWSDWGRTTFFTWKMRSLGPAKFKFNLNSLDGNSPRICSVVQDLLHFICDRLSIWKIRDGDGYVFTFQWEAE